MALRNCANWEKRLFSNCETADATLRGMSGQSGVLADSTLVSTDRGADGGRPLPRRLMVGSGQNVTTHMLPDEGTLTLGRAPGASIRVDDSSVSRLHARLHVGPVVRVEDLGSANGTRVGGARLKANVPTPIPPGQVVEIGSSWIMVANAPLNGSTTRHDAALPLDVSSEITGDKEGLVVLDAAMRNLNRLVERAAVADISILLLGETGVGKEVFARRIHLLSRRAGKPFVGLNCAALAASLLESELFGHEKGAFTGAGQAKPGLLETADGGTLLLDEVGEMPTSVQVKLLRVLEERTVLRIGGTRPRPIDVRILSATNRNLEAEVETGTFRRDLFFRLNGITVEIPPLRDRPSEIEPLGRRFVEQAAKRLGVPAPEVDRAVWDRLQQYKWPGNVRQLRNVIERAVVLAEGGRITPDVLPVDTYVGPVPKPEPPRSVAPAGRGPADDSDVGYERNRILEALERCAGNQTRAAEMLGISRRTLVSRLSDYDLPRPRKRGASGSKQS
jgi:two-component system response regulator AtoC